MTEALSMDCNQIKSMDCVYDRGRRHESVKLNVCKTFTSHLAFHMKAICTFNLGRISTERELPLNGPKTEKYSVFFVENYILKTIFPIIELKNIVSGIIVIVFLFLRSRPIGKHISIQPVE